MFKFLAKILIFDYSALGNNKSWKSSEFWDELKLWAQNSVLGFVSYIENKVHYMFIYW